MAFNTSQPMSDEQENSLYELWFYELMELGLGGVEYALLHDKPEFTELGLDVLTVPQ